MTERWHPDENLSVIARFEVRHRAYLAPDGSINRQLPAFASDTRLLVRLYRAMVLVRAFDLKAVALQLPLPQPIAQTVPKRSGWQWLSACLTHLASLPGLRTRLPPRPTVCKPPKQKTHQRRSWSQPEASVSTKVRTRSRFNHNPL